MRSQKIGVLTFTRANNYGAVLQNYALVEYLKKNINDCSVNTIDYRSTVLEEPYAVSPFQYDGSNPLKKVWYMVRSLANIRKFERLTSEFDTFRLKYLYMSKSYSQEGDNSLADDFDIFITGSDQVWNDRITGADPFYSLGFDTNARKVSYAASCGSVDYIGDATLHNIKSIDSISVREKDLKEYLEQRLERRIVQVLDPVFLLSKNEWDSLLGEGRLLKKKYIFAYSVSEKTDDVVGVAKNLAKKEKLAIVHLDHSLRYGVNGVKMYGASPLEFIQLIRDAEYVIASSFHAVAFSIIFQKRFVVVPTEKTKSRITNLLDITNASSNLFDNYKSFISNRREIKIADIEGITHQLAESKTFLQSAILGRSDEQKG